VIIRVYEVATTPSPDGVVYWYTAMERIPVIVMNKRRELSLVESSIAIP
jgi:hypothetical protein